MIQPLQKRLGQFLIKLNIPENTKILTLDICPKIMKTYVHIKSCSRIVTALFFVAKERE